MGNKCYKTRNYNKILVVLTWCSVGKSLSVGFFVFCWEAFSCSDDFEDIGSVEDVDCVEEDTVEDILEDEECFRMTSFTSSGIPVRINSVNTFQDLSQMFLCYTLTDNQHTL